MRHETLRLNELKLVGITARTSNQLEMDPRTAQIGPTIKHYFENKLAAQIENRLNPNTTYCVYTDYETNEYGPYTYFIGEAVTSFDQTKSKFTNLTVPTQTYLKLNVGPGQMPDICIHTWKEIWCMSEKDLGGKRAYVADFEIYDERALDPANAVFDIYVGLA